MPPQPPARPALPVASEDDPYDDFGIIVLHFAPSLELADFRRVAEAHGLGYAPTQNEAQLFRTPDDVEVAYGYRNVTPLPPHVDELLICGADGPNAPAVLALAEAMLAVWPRARWEADPGFAAILAQRTPQRRARRRKPKR